MSEQFDLVIIGTGAGGGTLAYALRESGMRILLVERGDFLPQEPQNWQPAEAFDRRGVRRIMADVDPDNIPSVRVFEKLGFGYEGRLRGEWETHLGIRDSLIYGLLREDPRPWRNWSL